jgi:hypothetical protein
MVGLNALWLLIGVIVLPVLESKDCKNYVAEYDLLNNTASKVNCGLSVGVGAIISVIYTAILIYPHIGFILEVKKGIMTKETYAREEFSCCCVSNRY